MAALPAGPRGAPPAPAATAALTPVLRRLTLVAMCIGQGMILLDNTIVNVALPAIQRGLGVTPGNLEWTINAYVLALASLIVLGGTLGDRYGRRRLFLVGLALFTLFSAGCGLARSDTALIALRGLQGVGAAIMAPLTLSILVDAYPPEDRPTAIGVWASVAGLGFGLGPIVGGLLIGLFGWPAIFWVNVPIGLAGFALTCAFVRESRDPGARSLDPVGTALVTAGLFVLTVALIETNVHPWTSAYTLRLGAIALAALAGFLLWEARTAHPMVPLGLFRDPVWSAANAVYALAYLSLAGMFFFVTLYFQNVLGWSAVATGLSWIPLNAPFLSISPFAGRIGRRFGAHRVIGVGAALAALGMLGLARLDATSGFGQAWPAYVLVGLGYGLLVPAVSSAAMAAVGTAHSGVGSGILNSSRQVGAAVGLAVLGSISVAAASSAWHRHLDALPPSARDRAPALVQQVAGAEARAVAAALGPEARAPAIAAFLAGYRTALGLGAGTLVVAAAVALVGMRPPSAPASGAPTGIAARTRVRPPER